MISLLSFHKSLNWNKYNHVHVNTNANSGCMQTMLFSYFCYLAVLSIIKFFMFENLFPNNPMQNIDLFCGPMVMDLTNFNQQKFYNLLWLCLGPKVMVWTNLNLHYIYQSFYASFVLEMSNIFFSSSSSYSSPLGRRHAPSFEQA